MAVHDEARDAADRRDVSALLYGYATGLDRRDWVLFRSIFHDTLEMNFASVGVEPLTVGADDWVERARRLFLRFGPTQHLTFHHQHVLVGDEATLVAGMQAEHFPVNPDTVARYTLGGFYHARAARFDEGWKLTALELEVTWRDGDRDAVMRR